MIDIIGPWNRSRHANVLDQIFRQRHRVFVEDLRWELPEAHDGIERDSFDGPRTVYLAHRDPRGRLLGSMRLIPSTEPHVLGNVFPELCDRGVPRGPDIFESSRSCIEPALREADRDGRIFGALVCGMLEYALIRELRAITAVMDRRMVAMCHAIGWPAECLGETREVAGQAVVGVSLPVSEAAVQAVRGDRGVPDPILAIRFAEVAQAA